MRQKSPYIIGEGMVDAAGVHKNDDEKTETHAYGFVVDDTE